MVTTLYLTPTQYSQLTALTDQVGDFDLSWVDFMQLYGVVVTSDVNQYNQSLLQQYKTIIAIPASQYYTTIALINAGDAAGGANSEAYQYLNYLFNANMADEETAGNPFPIIFLPDFTYDIGEPIPTNANFNAVFQNLAPNISTTFALYYINGDLINTQNVTTDSTGLAIVVFNTGVLTGTPSEIEVKVSQQISAALSQMRGPINLNKNLFIAVS